MSIVSFFFLWTCGTMGGAQGRQKTKQSRTCKHEAKSLSNEAAMPSHSISHHLLQVFFLTHSHLLSLVVSQECETSFFFSGGAQPGRGRDGGGEKGRKGLFLVKPPRHPRTERLTLLVLLFRALTIRCRLKARGDGTRDNRGPICTKRTLSWCLLAGA